MESSVERSEMELHGGGKVLEVCGLNADAAAGHGNDILYDVGVLHFPKQRDFS